VTNRGQHKTPKVSVVIPNYNHRDFLAERLNSVLNQSYQDFEVILLDDASSDGSDKLLQEYSHHPKVSHIIVNENNSGSTFAQWMLGLSHTKGDLIWIAESDDRSEASFLEALVPLFDNPQLALAYAQSYDIDLNGAIFLDRLEYTQSFKENIWENDFVLDARFFSQEYLMKKNVIPNVSAVVFRKVDLERVLAMAIPFKAFRKCGDWLIYAAMCNQTEKEIAFVAQHLNHFRHSLGNTRENNSETQKIVRLSEEWAMRKVYRDFVGWSGQWAKNAQRSLEKNLFQLSKGTHRALLKDKLESLCDKNLRYYYIFYWREFLREVFGRK